MAMTLRPYQAEARDAILQEWDQGRKRTLPVLPHGLREMGVSAAEVNGNSEYEP